jgi:N-acyl-D-aspartate/D-glutamate deacylase
MHDLIIRGASLIDGLGGAPKTVDLAVKDGRIAEIGAVSGPARETVDASGLSLMPGIIDVHTHYDAQLTWDPQCSPSPALGVTTVVIGNCGFGITPNSPDTRDILIKNLSEVEGMSLTALRAGIDWRFDDFGSYLDLLATRGVVPNVAAFACHSRSCGMRSTPAQLASPPPPSRTTTGSAACRCRRALPRRPNSNA